MADTKPSITIFACGGPWLDESTGYGLQFEQANMQPEPMEGECVYCGEPDGSEEDEYAQYCTFCGRLIHDRMESST